MNSYKAARNAALFKRQYFPEVDDSDWNNWKWQLRNRIQKVQELEKYFELGASEREAIEKHEGALPLAITPHYLSVFAAQPNHPLRKTLIPTKQEWVISKGELIDPLNEEALSPVKGIVHRYPDRVLFLATQNCAVYCRYCTRGRLVGSAETLFSKKDWIAGIEYIKKTPAVRDVLISGGDPLFIDNKLLEWLVAEISSIDHVEMVRIGSKIPAVLPQRIDDDLLDRLKKYHPIYFSIHFTHPDEITEEVEHSLNKIADAGIVMGSQVVLLKGVNDSVETMQRFMKKLLKCRVRPYAIYQCDPMHGTSHFRVPIEQGLKIMNNLRGHLSGYAVPHYIVDPPGGGGKISLHPENVLERNEEGYRIKNWKGEEAFYYDPIV